MALSGKSWISQFPTSNKVSDLERSFRAHVEQFLRALDASGARYRVSATMRPRQRAYLMHYAWCIWKRTVEPADVPAFKPKDGEAAVDIDWVHRTAQGAPDLGASRRAAEEMAMAYGLAGLKVAPALNSLHIQGKAIDMSISWTGDLTIKDATGKDVTIKGLPRDGANPDLIRVGATYHVIHLINVHKDPPHWSVNGH